MKTTIAFAALIFLAIGPAFSQEQAKSGHAHDGHESNSEPSAKNSFEAYDLDKNGKLSKAELAKHSMAAHASMVDADKDGALDRKEFAQLEKM